MGKELCQKQTHCYPWINPDLKTNPYAPGSRYQTIKSKYILTTIPNSGVFRPKEARGRVDWLVFTPKALTARSDLSFDQKSSLPHQIFRFKA